MKKVLHKLDDAKPAATAARLPATPATTRTATAGAPEAGDDNQRRASEVGPVLEEMLHARWNHWESKW